jgi:RNA polymerase sigma-70 factor, ECF subfamily
MFVPFFLQCIDSAKRLLPVRHAINCERRGSFCVCSAIQGREHSLLWPLSRNRTTESKGDADSDARLVEGLRQRDEHAILNLYDRHQRSVYRFLLHMTGSIASAEELTQQVFVEILDSMWTGTIGQFDLEKGTLEGYLIGIARNLARVEGRRVRRLLSLESALESREWDRMLDKFCQENADWDTTALLVTRSELTVLYRGILELPDHYREVIVLCSLQEKSYHDAAAILQCSEGTIASRMNRARRLLAAKLRPRHSREHIRPLSERKSGQ